MCFFFFFQAEDGIRDSSVTGVQTCALPIFLWFKSPDAPTHCRRKPEKAPGIELERLRPHGAALHGAEREDAKRLPHRLQAPDVVGSLLKEPGVALRVYRGGHDTVLPIRSFPPRDPPGVCIEPGEAIGIHLANPHVSPRVHRWLHQANVGLWERIEVRPRRLVEHPGCRSRCSCRCARSGAARRKGPSLTSTRLPRLLSTALGH